MDAEDGKVSWKVPFGILSVPQGTEPGRDFQGLQYKQDSRLLIADGCPEERDCGTHYYVWAEGEFHKKAFVPDPIAQ